MSRTSTTTSTEVPNLSKPKHDPKVYVALREQGFTNNQIADQLHVDEASVRRGLRKAGYKPYLLPAGVIKQLHVELEKPIRIDSKADGPGAVTADWHHPLANYGLIVIDNKRDTCIPPGMGNTVDASDVTIPVISISAIGFVNDSG